jgi:hypothetical protein
MTGDALQWYSRGDIKGIHAVNPLHSSPLYPSPFPEHFDCAFAQSPEQAKRARGLCALCQARSPRFNHRNRTTQPDTRNTLSVGPSDGTPLPEKESEKGSRRPEVFNMNPCSKVFTVNNANEQLEQSRDTLKPPSRSVQQIAQGKGQRNMITRAKKYNPRGNANTLPGRIQSMAEKIIAKASARKSTSRAHTRALPGRFFALCFADSIPRGRTGRRDGIPAPAPGDCQRIVKVSPPMPGGVVKDHERKTARGKVSAARIFSSLREV